MYIFSHSNGLVLTPYLDLSHGHIRLQEQIHVVSSVWISFGERMEAMDIGHKASMELESSRIVSLNLRSASIPRIQLLKWTRANTSIAVRTSRNLDSGIQ